MSLHFNLPDDLTAIRNATKNNGKVILGVGRSVLSIRRTKVAFAEKSVVE